MPFLMGSSTIDDKVFLLEYRDLVRTISLACFPLDKLK
jgi:hypothetical protein